MKDVAVCRFCSAKFESLSKKSIHFDKRSVCKKKLKEMAVKKLKQSETYPSVQEEIINLKEDVGQSEVNDTEPNKFITLCGESETNIKTAQRIIKKVKCSKCKKSFRGIPSFFHHKV